MGSGEVVQRGLSLPSAVRAEFAHHFSETDQPTLTSQGRPTLSLGWALFSFLCKLIEPIDDVFPFTQVLTLNFFQLQAAEEIPRQILLRLLCIEVAVALGMRRSDSF